MSLHTFLLVSPIHPEKGFIKGKALRLLLITDSSKTGFEEKIEHFQSYIAERSYQEGLVQRTFSEVLAFCNVIPLSMQY